MQSIVRCDNASMGVVITDPAGRLLMIDRGHEPAGIAPPSGHVFDTHTGYRDAAVAEVAEEVGLTVTALTDTGIGGWRHNQCGRPEPGPRGIGHDWRIYHATVTGILRPAPGETLGAAWYTPGQVQTLAERTIAYAREEIPTGQWALRPGIEPVWVQWLADLGLTTVPRVDLALIDQLTRPVPARVWVLDFAWQRESGETGRQLLYADLTAAERIALSALLAETTDPGSVITLPASTTPDGPRQIVALAISRIVGLAPYDGEGGDR